MLDCVDIPRLESLNKYWADHPPVQWMIAAYLGIEAKDKPNSKEDIEQLLSMFGTPSR